MKIAVFGGTFDPVHTAHASLAGEVLKRGYAEKLFFVPAFLPPHKIAWNVSSFESRRAMLELALKNLPGTEISCIEAERGGISYTFDTMNALAEKYPADELLLLIGGDSLANLHSWHRAEELVRRWRPLVYPRPHYTVSPETRMLFAIARPGEDPEGCLMRDVATSDLSGNALRELLSRGETPPEGMLDPAVLKWILKHGLYRNRKDGRGSQKTEEMS